MAATIQDDDLNKKYVFTSENVSNITKQMGDGYIPKNYQIPWFQKEVGVRKSGLSFQFTKEEFDEYLKCSQDVHHFAEKYCKIKREDGSIGEITLRDYQVDILNLFKNPRVILAASRQSGKCIAFNNKVELESGLEIRIGILFYNLLSTVRKLTFLEKSKIFLYNIIYKFENL